MEGKRKHPGRPRKSDATKRYRRTYWATNDEYQALKDRAASVGLTLSEYIRKQGLMARIAGKE